MLAAAGQVLLARPDTIQLLSGTAVRVEVVTDGLMATDTLARQTLAAVVERVAAVLERVLAVQAEAAL